jgi:hypothetical protein
MGTGSDSLRAAAHGLALRISGSWFPAQLVAAICGEVESERKANERDHEFDCCLAVKITIPGHWQILRVKQPVDKLEREHADEQKNHEPEKTAKDACALAPTSEEGRERGSGPMRLRRKWQSFRLLIWSIHYTERLAVLHVRAKPVVVDNPRKGISWSSVATRYRNPQIIRVCRRAREPASDWQTRVLNRQLATACGGARRRRGACLLHDIV